LASIWKWSNSDKACSGLLMFFFLGIPVILLALLFIGGSFISEIASHNLFLKSLVFWMSGWSIIFLFGMIILRIPLNSPEKTTGEKIIGFAFLMASLPILILIACLFVIFVILPLLIIALPLFVLHAIVNVLIRILKGPKALSRIAVRLGVLFLIIGTILQLIATF
jgi:hypothetical protein